MVVTHITRNMTEMGDIQYINSQWVLRSTLVPLHPPPLVPSVY